MPSTLTCQRWREDIGEWLHRGEAAEAIAIQHPEIPFRVCPIMGELHWFTHGEDIHEFSAHVRAVAKIFGTPIFVKTVEANTDKAPDMAAKWELGVCLGNDKVIVEVRSYSPNCRTHPDSAYVPALHIAAVYPKIHPECADVLKKLEDYQPEKREEATR
jgi:hypothetical protein